MKEQKILIARQKGDTDHFDYFEFKELATGKKENLKELIAADWRSIRESISVTTKSHEVEVYLIMVLEKDSKVK